MKRLSNSASLFGLDLSQLKVDWILALREIANWPALRWLAPVYVTRLKTATGETIDCIEKTGRVHSAQGAGGKVRFFGVLLPDNIVLWRRMVLPKLNADAARSAFELEVRRLSPFQQDDLVWGHTPLVPAPEGSKAYIAIASRKIIAQHIASLTQDERGHDRHEVWAEAPEALGFLELDGFGESLRKRLTARWRLLNLFLVFLLAAICVVAAATPTMQIRARALNAAQEYAKLEPLAAPAQRQREVLAQLDQQMKGLQTQMENRLEPELLLLIITKLLADDTYLTSMQVRGGKILLVGQTPNTAALMQQLGAQAGVKNVKAPSAAMRPRGADRETFNIEFTLDPSSLMAMP